MLKRKAFEAVCLSATRALSCTARELQNVSEQTVGGPIEGRCVASLVDVEYRLCSFTSVTSPVGCLDRAFSSDLTQPSTASFPFCFLASHHIPGHTGALRPFPLSRWAILPSLPRPQRMMLKHTRASRYAGADRSNGGGGFGGEQQPRWRRRWPRFKPSRKIMNTATLRELGELAAAEVATWSPKELAAAARRAVTLWRCEQPRAAAAIRIMQRLRLLPSPSSPQVLFQSPPDRGGSDRGSEDRRSGSTGDASGSGRELETRLLADAGGKGRKETFPRSRGIGRAAIQFPAAPPRNVTAAAPVRRRVVTGGTYNYAVVVEKPLRPHQLQLAQLVERLVRAANGRLPEGFGSRELSSFIWSLVALGYWQPPLVPLVSAFADYGAERLRSQPNPIATAMLLQVLAKARAAAASGQDTAAKLLELAPATTVAAAAALPGCLPSCEPRTLAGLLHSCAVLLSPERSVEGVRRLPLGPGAGSTVAAAAAGSGFGSGSGPQVPNGSEFEGHLGGRTTDALAALARSAVKECIRRRFYGFGAVDLLSAAGALAALQQYCYVPPPQLQSGSGNHRLGDDGGGNGGGGGGDGGEYEAAWALLSSAVSSRSPGGPPMAGATPRQRVDLLKIARMWGGSGRLQLQQEQQQHHQALSFGTVTSSERQLRPTNPRPDHAPASDA